MLSVPPHGRKPHAESHAYRRQKLGMLPGRHLALAKSRLWCSARPTALALSNLVVNVGPGQVTVLQQQQKALNPHLRVVAEECQWTLTLMKADPGRDEH